MAQSNAQPNNADTVGVEALRDMLLHLAETQPNEIDEKDECKDMIKSYFVEAQSLPVKKLI